MSNKKQQSLARFLEVSHLPPVQIQHLLKTTIIDKIFGSSSNNSSPKKATTEAKQKEKLHHLNRHPVPRKLELKQSLMRVVVVVVMVISRWKQNQNWKK